MAAVCEPSAQKNGAVIPETLVPGLSQRVTTMLLHHRTSVAVWFFVLLLSNSQCEESQRRRFDISTVRAMSSGGLSMLPKHMSNTEQLEIYTMSTFVSVKMSALAPNISIDVEYYALGIRKETEVSWKEARNGEGVVLLHYFPLNSSALTGFPLGNGDFVDATAAVGVSNDFDSDMWTSATLVSRVSGEALSDLISKCDEFEKSHRWSYSGVRVNYDESWDLRVDSSASSKGFVQWSLGKLASTGATLAPVVPTKVGSFEYVATGPPAQATLAQQRDFGVFLKNCANAYFKDEKGDLVDLQRATLTRDHVADILEQCRQLNFSTSTAIVSTYDGTPLLVPLSSILYEENELQADKPDEVVLSGENGNAVDWFLTFILVAAFGLGIKAFVDKTGLSKACSLMNRNSADSRNHSRTHRSDLYARLQHANTVSEIQLEQQRSSASAASSNNNKSASAAAASSSGNNSDENNNTNGGITTPDSAAGLQQRATSSGSSQQHHHGLRISSSTSGEQSFV